MKTLKNTLMKKNEKIAIHCSADWATIIWDQ